MEIKIDGRYQTRNGQAVKLLMVDGGGKHPVVGARQRPGGDWVSARWSSEGVSLEYDYEQGFDLVEIPEPAEVFYLNIYSRDTLSGLHPSRQVADAHASDRTDRLACKRVEWRPGEFDD